MHREEVLSSSPVKRLPAWMLEGRGSALQQFACADGERDVVVREAVV